MSDPLWIGCTSNGGGNYSRHRGHLAGHSVGNHSVNEQSVSSKNVNVKYNNKYKIHKELDIWENV